MSSAPPDSSGNNTVIMNLSENQSPSVWFPSEQQKPFQCGLCSVMFEINIDLVYHVNKHSLTKPFQCGYCKVSYDSNRDLTLHHGEVHIHSLVVVNPQQPNAGVDLSLNTCVDLSRSTGDNLSLRGGQEGCFLSPPASLSASSSAEHDMLQETSGSTSRDVSDGFESVTKTAIEIKSEPVELTDPNQQYDEELIVHFEQGSRTRTSGPREQNPCSKNQISDSKHVQHLNYNPSVGIMGEAAVCQADESSVTGTTPVSSSTSSSTERGTCFQCPWCETVLSAKSKLRVHMDTVHPDLKLFVCTLCSRGFNDLNIYQEHMACVHSDVKLFTCSLCPAQLKTKLRLSQHTREKHSLKEFECAECKQRFKLKRYLRKHWCTPRKCSLCDVMLSSAVTTRIHMEYKHGADSHPVQKKPSPEELPHQCPECKRRFKDKSKMGKHWCTPRKCSDCDTMLSSRDSYRIHTKRKHGTETDFVEKNPSADVRPPVREELLHRCAQCGQCFRCEYELDRHWCAPRKCSDCDVQLASKDSCKAHMMLKHATGADKTGTEESLHQCAECDRCFSCKYELNRHWCKPRKCSACDKLLASRSGYRLHMTRMHAKDKPFQCSHCDKAFSYKRDLTQHSIKHGGVKPYSCQYCGKSYFTPDGLKYHRNIQCKLRPKEVSSGPTSQDLPGQGRIRNRRYFCDCCDKKFFTSKSLQRHALTHADVRS